MKRLISLIIGIVFIAYPLLIYLGMTRFSPKVIGAGVLVLVGVRGVFLLGTDKNKWKQFLPLILTSAVIGMVSLVLNNERPLRLMPVFINGALLFTFGATLWRGPSMIERFAALKEKVITNAISEYCYKWTLVWCAFFVFNGSVAFYTSFYTSREYWTVYNGLISYILIGLLFASEMITRKIAMKKQRISNESDMR